MNEHLKSLLVAGLVTGSLFALNLSLVVSSAKASERVKTYFASRVGLEIGLEDEIVEKLREYLPKKQVDYSKVKHGG